MRPVTPRGFRDVLPSEAAERSSVAAAVSSAFGLWGYEPVETPVVELYETLETAAGSLSGTAFRLFDVDGTLLALRPDMTMPIARLAASRLSGATRPLRLSYATEVFREHESLRGQPRQFTQVGVELIGADGAWADAEILGVLADSLAASGLREFTIAVGTVAVLQAILEASSGSREWQGAVLDALHQRNLVELDRLAGSQPGMTGEVSRALRDVPRIRGGLEAIDQCRTYVEALGGGPVLDELEACWSMLRTAVPEGRLMIDFGVMRSFDYYTGLVFEAYAPELGVPLGGGGRYDGVLARFGAPEPAAGFALGLERLMIALVEQGVTVEVPEAAREVRGHPEAAFTEAARLRASGVRAVLAPSDGGDR